MAVDLEGIEDFGQVGGGGEGDTAEGGEAGQAEPLHGLGVRGGGEAGSAEGQEHDAEVGVAAAKCSGAGVAAGGGSTSLDADHDMARRAAGQVGESASADSHGGNVAAAAQAGTSKDAVVVVEGDGDAVRFELDDHGLGGVSLEPVAGVGRAVEAEHVAAKWGEGVGADACQSIEGLVSKEGGAVAVGGVSDA